VSERNGPRRARRAGLLLAVLWLAAAGIACGKKGPPLAPLRPTPARIVEITPRRLGVTAHVTVTIPAANLDGTQPVDLDRVDVYAFTGMRPTDIRDLKYATKIGSIPVQRVFAAAQLAAWETQGVPPPPNPGIAPGAKGTVTEALLPEHAIAVTPRDKRDRKPEPKPTDDPPPILPLAGPVEEEQPVRFYAAVGISRRNVKGPNSIRPSLPLDPPASPPRDVAGTFTETAIALAWAPPVEQRLPIQVPVVPKVAPAAAAPSAPGASAVAADPAATAPVAAASEALDPLPSKPIGVPETIQYEYNVYRVEPPSADATQPAVAPGEALPGTVPLNDKPLAAVAFGEPIVALGAERCYVVRAVHRGVESAPSAPACVTPVDNFPPPAPTQLAAIGSEGAVSLIWEGVTAADLAGYIVMRADGPQAGLTPLFEAPLRETSYRDATAKPGVRYVYAVVAVDAATPRNVSLPSNRVEEAAR